MLEWKIGATWRKGARIRHPNFHYAPDFHLIRGAVAPDALAIHCGLNYRNNVTYRA